MEHYDVIIIGGGPGGFTTALSAGNTYPDKKTAVIRKGQTSLIPCGIPYVFKSLDKIEDDILPDKPLENANVDIIIGKVVDVDINKKIVKLENGEAKKYEKLVFATGSKVFRPAIPGIEKDNVFFIKKDMKYLASVKNRLEDMEQVVIVGGGFIGIEIADELLKMNKKITIIEKLPTLLPLSMDEEFGDNVRQLLEDRSVAVRTGVMVSEITGDSGVRGVLLDDGSELKADCVFICAGYRPEIGLAEKAGLRVDSRYGILVDEYLRTSVTDVFAVGDCVAKRHFLTGDYIKLMLASTAMAQGRLLGSNLFKLKVVKEFPRVLGTFSTKVCNTAFASVGINEKDAQKVDLDYVTGHFNGVDRHPGKLPDARKISVKLIFARYSHVLLGAQIMGGDSVGEMINMLSVIIQNRMTDMEIDTLQIGTHPLLTSSPIAYPVINATVNAIMKWYRR